MKNKVTLTRARETISDAMTLVKNMSHSSSQEFEETGAEDLHSRHALGRHLLVLDGAMDRWGYERWAYVRERGLLAGCALATDESPPKQPRFRGLRFQISVLYVGEFKPLHTWHECPDPPIVMHAILADIMHCPGKKGSDVAKIVTQQCW